MTRERLDEVWPAIWNTGIDNDSVSSLKVAAGWKVTLYEHSNYGGTPVTFTGPTEVPCLVDHGFNDKASSLRIERA
jgi:hypothetical protein